MRRRRGRWLGGLRAAALLDSAGGTVRLQLDFSEGGLVLRDILRQDVQERLGLLRAQVNTLEVVDQHVLGRGLVHRSEHQEEVPEVDAYLDAIGIALAVIGRVHQDRKSTRLNSS